MAVFKRDIADINLETGNIQRTFLNHSIGLHDKKADHFGIRVFRNGEPVDLSGVSVQGVFMPPQGDPIAITSGNIISGNVAEVVLPDACYNYDGQFCLAIRLVDVTNSVTDTVRIVDGVVDNTHSGGTISPLPVEPTWAEIKAAYEQAITAASTVNAMAAKMAVDITAGAEATSNNSFKDLGNRWMTFRRGYYSTPSAGSTSSYTDDVNYVYALVACAPGDVFHAHGYGDGTSKSAWAFLDSSLKILDKGGSGNYEGATDPAPTSTACALVNVKLASLGSGYYGWIGAEAIKDQIATLKDAVSEDGNIIYSRDLKSAFDNLGVVPEGDYLHGTIIMKSPEYAAGDIIKYLFTTKTGLAQCIQIFSTSDTLITNIGRASTGSGTRTYSGEYTLPDNFGYAIIYSSTQSSALHLDYVYKTDSSVMIRTEIESKLIPAYEYGLYCGVVPNRKYYDGEILFTSEYYPSGTILNYDFTVIQFKVGMIGFYDSSDTRLGYLGYTGTSTHSNLNPAGTYTIPDNFAYAKVSASTDAYITINNLAKSDSTLLPRYEAENEWNVVHPVFIDNNNFGSTSQGFNSNKFSMSVYLKVPKKKIRISFASPWTINLLEFSDITYDGNYSNASGWKTNGSYTFTFSGEYVRILVSKEGYSTVITAAEAAAALTVSVAGEMIETGLSKYVFATVGDSITYGTDPDNGDSGQIANPWPEMVANLNQFGNVINCGVASARVLGFNTPNPPPRVWSTEWNTVPEQADIICVMIGINDMLSAKAGYAGYVLGQMSDRTGDSFYGGLHMMWQGLISRFPASSGKKLFMMQYPYDPVFADYWDDWMGATVKVAEYYGIPILYLDKELGVSVAGDVNHDYWRIVDGKVDAHPTQALANIFADTIANFINSHFSVN